MDREQLRRYLEFYQDLGISSLYRREAAPEPVAREATPEPVPVAAKIQIPEPVIEMPRAKIPDTLLPLSPEGDSLLKADQKAKASAMGANLSNIVNLTRDGAGWAGVRDLRLHQALNARR